MEASDIGSEPTIPETVSLGSIKRETQAQRELFHQLKKRRLVQRRFAWVSPQGAMVTEPYDVDTLSYQTTNHTRGYSGYCPAGSTTTILLLDRLVTLEAATTYTLIVRHLADDATERRVVSTGAGVWGAVAPTVAFATAPAEGAIETLRLSRLTEGVVVHGHGRLYEVARLGKLFTACTGAAGVAPGTALSTTPPFTLYNPQNSGKLLIPVKAAVGYISGTLGAGTIVYGVSPSTTQAPPASGSELTPMCTLVGAARGVGRVFEGGTLATAPTIYRPLAVLSAFNASSDVGNALLIDEVDGEVAILHDILFTRHGVGFVLRASCFPEVRSNAPLPWLPSVIDTQSESGWSARSC